MGAWACVLPCRRRFRKPQAAVDPLGCRAPAGAAAWCAVPLPAGTLRLSLAAGPGVIDRTSERVRS